MIDEPIAIACGVDGAYALPLAVTIRSILASLNTGHQITFYVLDGGISPADRERLERTASGDGVSLVWVSPQHFRLGDLPTFGGMSLSTYYRLLLDECLPDAVKKVLWLDADLLVVQDLSDLYALDPGPHLLSAAQDMVIPYVSCPLGVSNWRRLGLLRNAPHFNAGVMLINLDLWRSERISSQILDYLRRNARTVALHDQEALNAVLTNRWSALDDRWNCIASVAGRPFQKTLRVSDKDAWIFHFAGDWKPWTLPYGRYPYDLYYQRLDETPWAGWRPDNSIFRSSRAFYHEHLRDLLYPLESAYTNLRYGRLLRQS